MSSRGPPVSAAAVLGLQAIDTTLASSTGAGSPYACVAALYQLSCPLSLLGHSSWNGLVTLRVRCYKMSVISSAHFTAPLLYAIPCPHRL